MLPLITPSTRDLVTSVFTRESSDPATPIRETASTDARAGFAHRQSAEMVLPLNKSFTFFSLLMLIVLYPIFLFLVRHKCVAILTWLFAFIFVVFTCFSIEFGQYLTGTGSMELSDVTYGVMGFAAASCVALALLLFIKCLIAVIRLIRRRAARSRNGQPTDSGTDMT